MTGTGLTGEDRTGKPPPGSGAAGRAPAGAKAAGRDRSETTAGHDPSPANANGRAGAADGATGRVGVGDGATGRVGAEDDVTGPVGAGDDGRARVEDDMTAEGGATGWAGTRDGASGRADAGDGAFGRAGAKGGVTGRVSVEDGSTGPVGAGDDGRAGVEGDVTAPSAREAASAVPASGGPDVAGEPEGAGPDRGRKATAVRRAGRPRFRTAVAVTLLLAFTGGALQVMGDRARHVPATRDRALVDAETTALVIGDVGNGLSTVFSYAPGSTAATEQAAGEVLGGAALSQYRTLFAQVKQRAAAERLTVTTHVVRAGVTDLSGRTAHVLVFLDQVVTRRDRPQGTPVAAQLSVTARLDAGHWRIIDINAL